MILRLYGADTIADTFLTEYLRAIMILGENHQAMCLRSLGCMWVQSKEGMFVVFGGGKAARFGGQASGCFL